MRRTLSEQLDSVLSAVDAGLAQSAVPLTDRPLRTALTLVQQGIVTVSVDRGATTYEPDGSTEFVVTPWFRALYKEVEGWYRDTYGVAFDRRSEKAIRGVVLFRGTPFALRVPTSRIRPAEPGKTIWLSVPDHVEADDVVVDWLVKPPNLERLKAPERAALDTDIGEVAGALRFVHSNLMGVAGDDDALDGFRHGVLTHSERAADLIHAADGDSVQMAWWELQMTTESALKGLLLQKTGRYPRTHDLSELLDASDVVGLRFDHLPFDGWPKKGEMSGLRYAQGARRDVESVFGAYRLALAVAAAAAGAMDRMRLGDARFEIAQAPWTLDKDPDAEPHESEKT